MGRQPYAKRECALLYSDVFAPCHNVVSIFFSCLKTHSHTHTHAPLDKVISAVEWSFYSGVGVMGTAVIEKKTLFSRKGTSSTKVDVNLTKFLDLTRCFIVVI